MLQLQVKEEDSRGNLASTITNISSLKATNDKQNHLLHKLCLQEENKNVFPSVAKSNHSQKKQFPPVIANTKANENTIHLREKNISVNLNSVFDKEDNAINNSKTNNFTNNGNNEMCDNGSYCTST